VNRIVLCACLLLATPLADADCSRQEALDLAQRIDRFRAEYFRDPSTSDDALRAFAIRRAEGEQLLARERYAAACTHFAAMADDHDLSLEWEGELSVAEINAWEENPPEGCGIRSIVDRTNQATRNLDAVADPERRDHLASRRVEVARLLRTDLAAACQASRELQRQRTDSGSR